MTYRKEKLTRYGLWLILSVLAVWYFFNFPIITRPLASQAELLAHHEVRVTLQLGDLGTRVFEGPADPQQSVLKTLYAATTAGKLEMRYSINSRAEVKLETMAGLANGAPARWIFSLNGQVLPTNKLDRTLVKSGDLIVASYE